MENKDQVIIDLTGLHEHEKNFVEDIVKETTKNLMIHREENQIVLSGPKEAIRLFRSTMRIALEKSDKPDNN